MKKETAQVVIKKILEDIFPRFGLPKVIGSNNGPAFMAQVSQGLDRTLGINWKLHCVYRPQSSGQVERMNGTIKETLTKLSLETGIKDWTMLLPYTLFRSRNTPSVSLCNLTPYEVLYGTPPPIRDLTPTLRLNDSFHTPLLDRLKALEKTQQYLWKQLAASCQPGDEGTPHQYQVGDFVYIRRHQVSSLEPRWKGTWWACDSGLTPCISAQIFNNSVNYCVMVQIFPRVLYHDANTFEDQIRGYTT
ncbi:Hypothetical predicted protein [Marmota monax]|uniref:Integrase catalytic domain-containing protein n=1 Tax=Marmota monax TaxID=9995 RepID=A0A5E4CCS1_MARMO|nr:hypothetical protein GHT09_002636 [Marmota monax]VTJ79744.1 Hypothetical predicted protein [Marmota monax]